MSEKLGQKPAYPIDGYHSSGAISQNNTGMSKRFYAACAAMQGLLANSEMMKALSEAYSGTNEYHKINNKLTELSYIHADELLKQEK